MLEHLMVDAHVAEYERYAREHEKVRQARKLFPRTPKKRVEREPVNPPEPREPRPDPLTY
ncbi:MAG: hypothetical protein U5Q44_06665 [Dehalococcoidia bacterium]|nr:hypothetical protein [Dehalococcoidia bacterium]